MRAGVYLLMALMVSSSLVSMVAPSGMVSASEEPMTDIVIDGDDELKNCSYVTGGPGIYGSPYIISDLDMGGRSVKVSNNTLFLTFRNITFSFL